MRPDLLREDIASISKLGSVPAILKIVSELTGMRVALVARVTPESWTACAVYDRMEFGLKVGDQLEVATTLCKEVHDSQKAIIIEHASKDPLYSVHRTPKLYNIESYIAIPILQRDGTVFGTLCAIDRDHALLPPKIVQSLELFTELIQAQLVAEQSRRDTELLLDRERKLSELREQFIAILGHDLRGPLSGISSTTDLLAEMGGEPVAPEIVAGLRESVDQMAALISRTLDFARTKLGGGLDAVREPVADLTTLVRTTVDELATGPDRHRVLVEAPAVVPAHVDPVRIRQVMGNLIGNALRHGVTGHPIQVKLETVADVIQITVSNRAAAMSEETLRAIFEPFRSSSPQKHNPGLGLGLYIASEIVKAHGGTISAAFRDGTITFTFQLPLQTK